MGDQFVDLDKNVLGFEEKNALLDAVWPFRPQNIIAEVEYNINEDAYYYTINYFFASEVLWHQALLFREDLLKFEKLRPQMLPGLLEDIRNRHIVAPEPNIILGEE